jgi:SAM-dependent methyltransferase
VNRIALDGKSLITPETIATAFVPAEAGLGGKALSEGKAQLALALNLALQQFEQGRDPVVVIYQLIGQLHKMREKLDPGVWRALLPIAQHHPVAAFFHQDPFTRWSFRKPRGYSGDAQLLDFIYGHPSVEGDIANATPVGKALYSYTKHASAPVAVRERRDLLTLHIDEMAAARGPDIEILTIAAGHLREADGSTALREGRIKRWVALDQDPLSVGSIARDFQGTRIEAIDGSVRGLLTRGYNLGTFDFVYSAGLYDYLSHNVAVKLTQKCMQMLKPDGVLLFANFAEDIFDDGYMETFMNWPLLLRSEADMWNIVNASVDRNRVEASVHFGANRNILYATIRNRSESQMAPMSTILGRTDRFEVVMEPTDQWLVWDIATDLPADLDGQELFGLSHADALMFCERLNRSGLSHYQIDSYR